MGQPIPLQAAYPGMRQDNPRDAIPDGALWNMVDWIPQRLGQQLLKRGGWRYGSPALSGASRILGLARSPDYGAGAYNVAIDDTGEIWTFTDAASVDEGAAVTVLQNPVVHRTGTDWLIVIPADDGTTAPKQWTGPGSIADLGGSPPAAIYAAVWNDRTLLANGTAGSTRYVGRLWFGPIGDAAGAWDTTNSWWDFNLPIVGLGVTRNAILAFHARTLSRLRGNTAPTALAESDLVEDEPLSGDASVGCIDARSIVHYNDNVLWADFKGVYESDGVTIKNLIAEGGLSDYWRGDLVNWADGWSIASGVFKDFLIVSIVDDSHAPVDCLVYDLLLGWWFRFKNVPGQCFLHLPGQTADKLYMGLSNAGQIANLETVFLQQTAADDDGTAVLPLLETTAYRGFQRLHRRWIASDAIQNWLRLYFNYELVDGGAAPTLKVSYSLDALDRENVTYRVLDGELPASTLTSRVRRDMSKRGRSLALKIEQTEPSVDTMLRAIEAEYYALEPSRLEPLSLPRAPVTVWQPLTSYVPGQLIVPPVPNGHTYKNDGGASQTTGATPPVFPTDGSSVADGSADWCDIGADFNPVPTIWAPNTVYANNSVVVPPVPNGHVYCTYPNQSGTSGAWPIGGQADPWTAPYDGTDAAPAGADWPTGGPTADSFSGLDNDMYWVDLGPLV